MFPDYFILIQVGITPEEHEKVAKILSDNKIATRELLKKSLDANSYDYISATYLLLAEQVSITVLDRDRKYFDKYYVMSYE